MPKHKKDDETCFFWSPKDRSCKLSSEGLFIPLDDHIEIYCKSPDHKLCLQYSMSVHAAQQEDSAYEDRVNRRAYTRFNSTHQVTLVRLKDSGNIAFHHATKANTLDLSSGGMRLVAREPIMSDTLMQFSFDDSFPELLQKGVAKTRWCRSVQDSLDYQIGIEFIDDEVKAAMDSFLKHLKEH